jgi:gentisate 1,2-dioxygenase
MIINGAISNGEVLMAEQSFKFIDRTGAANPDRLTLSGENRQKFIPPVIVKKEMIDAEIERLAGLPAPANGRRMSLVAHPETGVGDGLAPGIAVSLNVLKPGEKTAPIRQNSFLVDFCILGAGHAVINARGFDYQQYDAWTTPPWMIYQRFNDTNELQAWLSYSNSPLLEKLGVYVVDENPPLEIAEEKEEEALDHSRISPYGTFQLTEQGAWLMPYEKLIAPDHIKIKPLLWPWKQVQAELNKLRALGKDYVGRRLYLLYDPTTGRVNGTTNSFFATITIRPANIVDRPHRHVSAAINYYFAGSGYSVVEGRRYDWSAGDLMLSAPGWAVHNHASKDEEVYELTIQDQPMHLALGSLLWHEDLKKEIRLLGLSDGFLTNRAGVGG